MAIVLADNTPRIEYTVAQGVTQTVFPIPFVFFNKEDSSNVDVKVFVDGVERTLGSISTTTFSITSGGNGAKGSLSTTVTGASGGSTVIVLRDTKIGRTTDFPSGGAFEVSKLNTELDTLVAIEGDFEDHVSRSIRLQDKDTAVSLALPLKADRLGKQLGFNATTGAVEMFTPESLAIASDSGSSSVDLTSNTFTFTGGEGIDTSISNQTLTITGELASTSNKGVASFNSTNFTVSSGAVTANDITLASDSGSATNTLGETFTLSGGTGLTTSATGSTVTMNVDAAQTGITSLLATDIKIGEDDQTKIDFETADQINFYANNVNVVQLSNTNSGDAVFTVPTSDKDFVIKGNDGGSTITALTIDMSNSGDASFNNNVTVGGNLTVNGSSTTVNTATLTVEDPLISLASGNNSADSVDVGFYGLYDTSGSQDLYAGLFRDASDSGKFKLFKDLQVEPTTTVNTSGTGYAVGTLVANLEGTIQTAAQTNITSLGTLTELTIDGDTTFTGTSGNIVFDKSNNGLEFQDDIKAIFGTGEDFLIFHSGTNTILRENQGNPVYIQTNNVNHGVSITKNFAGETMAKFLADGPVELYHNNVKKLETTSTGATVTGTLVSDGISVGDNEDVLIGTGGDLKIFHDGTNNIFRGFANPMYIQTDNTIHITKNGATETMAKFISDGAVELYYNSEKNFETHIDGVTVGGDKGILQVNGTNASIGTTVAGVHLYADFYRERGFSIFNKALGSSGLVEEFFMGVPYGDSAQPFVIKTNDQNETALKINQLGAVELYYNNEKKFQTRSNGFAYIDSDVTVEVTNQSNQGAIEVGGTSGAFIDLKSPQTDDFDLRIQSYNNVSTIRSDDLHLASATGTENYLDATLNGAVNLYYDNVKRFETDAFGATVTGRLKTTQNIDIENTSGYGRIEIGGASGGFIDLKSPFSDDFDHRIITTGAGASTLQLQSDDFHLMNRAGTENYLDVTVNGAVNLYYDNVKKFETTSDGATVTGGLTVVGGNSGDVLLTFATDRSWQFQQSGDNASTRLQLKSNVDSKLFDICTTDGSITHTFFTSTSDPTMTLTAYDADATEGPTINLTRNSASPAVNDLIGAISFKGEDSASNEIEYGRITGIITDPTDGSEDGLIRFEGVEAGNRFTAYQIGYSANFFYRDLHLMQNTDIRFEGSTDDNFETLLTVTDPTADRTITLPDATGTINELLISSGSVSNVSNIEFNSSLITTEFSSYRLVLLNVKVDTDQVNFSMRVGTANSADTSNNYWQSNFIYGVFDNSGTSTAAATQIIEHDNTYFALAYNTGALGTGTGENGHFEINLLNANSTSCYKHIRLNQAIYSYYPAVYGRRIDAAMFASNSALNFLQVFPHVGNIASADYRLYGVK